MSTPIPVTPQEKFLSSFDMLRKYQKAFFKNNLRSDLQKAISFEKYTDAARKILNVSNSPRLAALLMAYDETRKYQRRYFAAHGGQDLHDAKQWEKIADRHRREITEQIEPQEVQGVLL